MNSSPQENSRGPIQLHLPSLSSSTDRTHDTRNCPLSPSPINTHHPSPEHPHFNGTQNNLRNNFTNYSTQLSVSQPPNSLLRPQLDPISRSSHHNNLQTNGIVSQPYPTNPTTINQLEDVADSTPAPGGYSEKQKHIQSQFSSSLQSHVPASPPPPLLGMDVCPNNRKRKKIQPSQSTRPLPQPYEEMMKQSEAELIMEAKKGSKKSMSDADRLFFADYASQQRKMMCIKAIERGVSMPMVHSFLGKRLSLRQPSSWNRFMMTKNARAVFQGRYRGVKHSPAMGGVSQLWKQLTPEDKERFRQTPAANTNNGSETNGVAHDQPGTNQIVDNEENFDDEVVGIENQVGMRRAISLKVAATEVENHLDEWETKAVHIASTFSCEMVVFAVSKFLGQHSFQFTRSTPGATDFVQGAERVDGSRSYPSRMQSYLTGYQVNDLAISIAHVKGKVKGNSSLGVKGGREVSAVSRMSEMVEDKTGGVVKKWPWTKTDYNLARVNYRLVLDPEAKIDVNWLKRPSRELGPKRQAAINIALDQNHINIVYDPSISNDLSPESLENPGQSSSSSSASPHPDAI